jgi:transglutaminase-like putative cysteine protease
MMSRLLLVSHFVLFFFAPLVHAIVDAGCRSNSTHVAWPRPSITSKERRLQQACCEWQTVNHARRDAYEYLEQRILSFDRPFRETMGFSNESNAVDGLTDGLIGPTIEYALQAKVLFRYTDELPREIWEEYVLNYLHLNEARSNWRPYLFQKLSSLVISTETTTTTTTTTPTTLTEAVYTINTYMWQRLAAPGTSSITFVAGSTPLIFDPMSVLIYGHGSCTGLSILFASALRAVGVPARVAGTAAWNADREQGNHNWIEVWHDGWHFLEPTASEEEEADRIERDPCERWFCHASRWNGTQAFAARLEHSINGTFFPLAWEKGNEAIPAENRTAYYQQTCGQCN